MSDLDVKPDVSSEVSREASAPAYEQRPRARRAVLVFEDDPDFGEFLAPRPQALHPSLIQYSQSTPAPAPQPLHRPPNLGHPATGHAPPNLGHSERSNSQQPVSNYQSVEVGQVERPSAARPWPAPPSEYAGRPQQGQAKQGGVSPFVVLGIFALLALGIGAFVYFFDKKVKRDEINHVRQLVAEVVAEYRAGKRVPEQLKEVVETLDGVIKSYGFEPVEVEKLVKTTTTTRAVAAEL